MKERVVYVCDRCGYESPKWFGRCPSCGAWNSAVEVKKSEKRGKSSPSSLMKLSQISVESDDRLETGDSVIDSILGGGFVKGQVVLLGGEPGIGKSTLALQIANHLVENGKRVLYASGEESAKQIKIRASRINVSGDILVTNDQDIDSVLKSVSGMDFLIIDSVQTFYDSDVGSIPGGIAQIRSVTSKVVEFSKKNSVVSLIIGHITKSGDIAGPKIIEHIVDTVLYFEGERTTDYRLLRVYKNRFGPSGEVGIFEMREEGLLGIENPVFVGEDLPFGNAVACVVEGSHPLIVQIQALVSKSRVPSPRRNSVGVDHNRVSAIIATMSKILKLPLDFHDVYVKVLGGLRITDPAVDLAISAAVFSSLIEMDIGRTVFMGEVGLDGMIRTPYSLRRRLETLKKSGFDELAGNFEEATMKVRSLSNLSEVIK